MSDGGFHEAQMNNMEMTSVSVEEEILFVETERACHSEFKGSELQKVAFKEHSDNSQTQVSVK